MPPDRPVRLTFPSYDIGAARIIADGKQAGHILGETYGWRAYLWEVADKFPVNPDALETTWYPTLTAVRVALRSRVALKGPWWSA